MLYVCTRCVYFRSVMCATGTGIIITYYSRCVESRNTPVSSLQSPLLVPTESCAPKQIAIMLSSSLVSKLVNFDLDINKKNSEGQTALMLAAKKRNLEAMTALLENSHILISTGDKDNKTVLHILLETFNKTEDETCKNFSHILMLILKLSSEVVNWKDNKGVTPIMIAAKNKQLDVVDYLLECGAIVKTDEKSKETILHLMLQ